LSTALQIGCGKKKKKIKMANNIITNITIKDAWVTFRDTMQPRGKPAHGI
jgi:hypothetical protein